MDFLMISNKKINGLFLTTVAILTNIFFLNNLAKELDGVAYPTYKKVVENIEALGQDPLMILDNLHEILASKKLEITLEERETLKKQLENLKCAFCERQMSSIIFLPVLATIFFGVKSCFDYLHMKSINKNSILLSSMYSKSVNDFMGSLCHFSLSLAIAFFVNMEHRNDVSSLFLKERAIKNKIDKIMVLL